MADDRKERLFNLTVSVLLNGGDAGEINVSLYKDNELVAQLPPAEFSTFQLALELNASFSVRIAKPGYREKVLAVDTHLPEGVNKPNEFTCVVDLEPMDRYAHSDAFYLDFPCAIIRWHESPGGFTHSAHYSSDIQLKMALLATQTE